MLLLEVTDDLRPFWKVVQWKFPSSSGKKGDRAIQELNLVRFSYMYSYFPFSSCSPQSSIAIFQSDIHALYIQDLWLCIKYRVFLDNNVVVPIHVSLLEAQSLLCDL